MIALLAIPVVVISAGQAPEKRLMSPRLTLRKPCLNGAGNRPYIKFSLTIATIWVLIALVVFIINWHVVGGGWWLFSYALAPGNFVLSLFTEEIDFWPKFALLMSGQFFVTFAISYDLISALCRN